MDVSCAKMRLWLMIMLEKMGKGGEGRPANHKVASSTTIGMHGVSPIEQ